MGGKRIIVDHHHAMRQHKAFAIMIIVLLLVVVAVWFVQIRLMVRRVDFSKVSKDVTEAQATLLNAFDDDIVADDVTDSASAAATMVNDAVTEAQDAIAADERARAEVAARAAALLQDQASIDTPTTAHDTTTPTDVITE